MVAQVVPVMVFPVLLKSPLPVKVRTFSLPLKVFQSVLLRTPVVPVLAVGKVRLETAVT